MKKILAIFIATFLCQIAAAEVDVTYDPASGVVHIPQVRVIGDESGTTYTVEMVNGNDGSFYITDLTENIPVLKTFYNHQQFSLELMDVDSFGAGLSPIPEGLSGLAFSMNDAQVFIDLSGLPANATYVDLFQAIQKGIQNLPAEYENVFTVRFGGEFNVFSADGFVYVGTKIILTSHLYDSLSPEGWFFGNLGINTETYTAIIEM